MKLTFVVLRLNQIDRIGESIDCDGCHVPAFAPVTKEFRQGWMNRLGVAKLTKVGNEVIAEWEWPGGDKLPSIALYPAVSGAIAQREDKRITACEIREIAISSSPNVDETILSIQEQNPDIPIAWESGQTSLLKRPFEAEKLGHSRNPIVS